MCWMTQVMDREHSHLLGQPADSADSPKRRNKTFPVHSTVRVWNPVGMHLPTRSSSWKSTTELPRVSILRSDQYCEYLLPWLRHAGGNVQRLLCGRELSAQENWEDMFVIGCSHYFATIQHVSGYGQIVDQHIAKVRAHSFFWKTLVCLFKQATKRRHRPGTRPSMYTHPSPISELNPITNQCDGTVTKSTLLF